MKQSGTFQAGYFGSFEKIDKLAGLMDGLEQDLSLVSDISVKVSGSSDSDDRINMVVISPVGGDMPEVNPVNGLRYHKTAVDGRRCLEFTRNGVEYRLYYNPLEN